MYHRFKWTRRSEHRNRLLSESEPVQPFYLMALAEAAGCRTFLDVGANIGTYALFATQLPTLERCMAFEPNPTTARELRANIALNHAAVEVVEAAISAEAGEISFGVVSDLAGDNAVLDTALHSGFKGKITVPTMTLDSLLDLPEPICIKMDVEGHEREAVAGASALLRRPCVVQVEDFQSTMTAVLGPLGYFQLTAIGPDHYFANMEGLRGRAVEFYETAMRALIASTGEAEYSSPTHVMLRCGDFTLRFAGRSAARLKKAKALIFRKG